MFQYTIIKYYFGELILKLNSHYLYLIVSIGPQSTNHAGQTIIKSAAAEFNIQQLSTDYSFTSCEVRKIMIKQSACL